MSGMVLRGSLILRLLCVITMLLNVVMTRLRPLMVRGPLIPVRIGICKLILLTTWRMLVTLLVDCMNDRVTRLVLACRFYCRLLTLPLDTVGMSIVIFGRPRFPRLEICLFLIIWAIMCGLLMLIILR